MNWVIRTFSTSIGKKQLMAVTGTLFLLFLAAHLAGNLTIYSGAQTFNAYSERLHALGGLLVLTEVGLVLCAIIHIVTALILFLENRKSRPVKYAVDKSGGGGRTLSSRTMPYTGLLILLFVIVHLSTVSRFFVDRTNRTTGVETPPRCQNTVLLDQRAWAGRAVQPGNHGGSIPWVVTTACDLPLQLHRSGAFRH